MQKCRILQSLMFCDFLYFQTYFWYSNYLYSRYYVASDKVKMGWFNIFIKWFFIFFFVYIFFFQLIYIILWCFYSRVAYTLHGLVGTYIYLRKDVYYVFVLDTLETSQLFNHCQRQSNGTSTTRTPTTTTTAGRSGARRRPPPCGR